MATLSMNLKEQTLMHLADPVLAPEDSVENDGDKFSW